MRTVSSVDLLTKWRRQVARRTRRSPQSALRGVGAMGLLVDGNQTSDLVEIEKLFVLIMHDEEFSPGRVAVRLSGYRVSRVEHGVQWGGTANSRLVKDLALAPRQFARGLRVDLTDATLLELALRLDRRIDQALRFQPSVSRRQLRLPGLWAGYQRSHEEKLTGSGPEFQALCERFKIESDSMFRKFRREYQGLVLYPLDFLTDQLGAAVAVFAEMHQFPQCHAFGLGSDASGLVGYLGASAFDFCSTNFAVAHRRQRAQMPA